MITTNHKILRFKTSLPYNYIYYVTGCQEPLQGATLPSYLSTEIAEQWLGFPLRLHKIQSEMLTEEKISQTEWMRKAPKNISADEVVAMLREVFPVSTNGIFVIRLLPSNEEDKEANIDTLLIGQRTNYQYDDATDFLQLAVKENVQRMTGMSFDDFEKHIRTFDDGKKKTGTKRAKTTSTKKEKDIQQLSACHFEEIEETRSYKKEFQTIRMRSDTFNNTIQKNQQKILEKYLKKFANFGQDDRSTFEQFNDLIKAAFEDMQNVGKLNEECPIKVQYSNDTMEYEVMVCPKNDAPILCKFGRGQQSKALYIFYLRHPEGVCLKDLKSEEHLNELAEIYAKFRYYDKKTSRDCVKNLVDVISQHTHDIRNMFEEIFVPYLAGKYAISGTRGTPFCIDLHDNLVDLGKFGKRSVL